MFDLLNFAKRIVKNSEDSFLAGVSQWSAEILDSGEGDMRFPLITMIH